MANTNEGCVNPCDFFFFLRQTVVKLTGSISKSLSNECRCLHSSDPFSRRSAFLDCSSRLRSAQPSFKEVVYRLAHFLPSSPIPFPADNYNRPVALLALEEPTSLVWLGIWYLPGAHLQGFCFVLHHSQPAITRGDCPDSARISQLSKLLDPPVNLTPVRLFNTTILKEISRQTREETDHHHGI